MAVQQPDIGLSFSLHLDSATAFELKAFLQPLVHASRDLDSPRHTCRFHPTGKVHRIAPEIVDELSDSYHPCDNGTGVEPDAQLEVQPLLLCVLPCRFRHAERHEPFGQRGRSRAWASRRQPCNSPRSF